MQVKSTYAPRTHDKKTLYTKKIAPEFYQIGRNLTKKQNPKLKTSLQKSERKTFVGAGARSASA